MTQNYREAKLIAAGFPPEKVNTTVDMWQVSDKAKVHFRENCVPNSVKATVPFISLSKRKRCFNCGPDIKISRWFAEAQNWAGLYYHVLEETAPAYSPYDRGVRMSEFMQKVLTVEQKQALWLSSLRLRATANLMDATEEFRAWAQTKLVEAIDTKLAQLGDAATVSLEAMCALDTIHENYQEAEANSYNSLPLIFGSEKASNTLLKAYVQATLAGADEKQTIERCTKEFVGSTTTFAAMGATRINKLPSKKLEKYIASEPTIGQALHKLWEAEVVREIPRFVKKLSQAPASEPNPGTWGMLYLDKSSSDTAAAGILAPHFVGTTNRDTHELWFCVPPHVAVQAGKNRLLMANGLRRAQGQTNEQLTAQDLILAEKLLESSDTVTSWNQAFVLAQASRLR